MKAVIFDMDGLLVDTESMSFAIYQTLLSPYQISLVRKLMPSNTVVKQKKLTLPTC